MMAVARLRDQRNSFPICSASLRLPPCLGARQNRRAPRVEDKRPFPFVFDKGSQGVITLLGFVRLTSCIRAQRTREQRWMTE